LVDKLPGWRAGALEVAVCQLWFSGNGGRLSALIWSAKKKKQSKKEQT